MPQTSRYLKHRVRMDLPNAKRIYKPELVPIEVNDSEEEAEIMSKEVKQKRMNIQRIPAESPATFLLRIHRNFFLSVKVKCFIALRCVPKSG